MDFVAKALGSLGGLPFSLGAEIPPDPDYPQLFRMHEGTIRKSGASCTVFVYDTANTTQAEIAQHAGKMLLRLRIPGVLKMLEIVESGSKTYVVTEPVRPLYRVLPELTPVARKSLLLIVLRTLVSLHEAGYSPCCVCSGTIFITAEGLWALGPFDVTETTLPMLPCASALVPPDGATATAKDLDTYQFGVLVGFILPGQHRLVQTLCGTRRPPVTKLIGSSSINKALDSPLTQIIDTQAVLLDEPDLREFLALVRSSTTDLPGDFVASSLIPQLVQTGTRGSVDTITTVLVLASSKLTQDQFQRPFPYDANGSVATYVASLFSSMDRAVRLELLRLMPHYLPLMPDKIVQTQILPALAPGFADTEVRLRSASVQIVAILAPKLTERQRNGELLRLLARTHNDPDAGVRVLTTSVLTELAPLLDARSSVIAAALGKSLRDPASEVRVAALSGVRATAETLSAREVADKLVGPTAVAVLDKDGSVSAEASAVLDFLVAKIKGSSSVTSTPAGTAASTPTPSQTPLQTHLQESTMTSRLPATSTNLGVAQTPSPVSADSILPHKAEVPASPMDGDDGWGWDGLEDESQLEETQEDDNWGW